MGMFKDNNGTVACQKHAENSSDESRNLEASELGGQLGSRYVKGINKEW